MLSRLVYYITKDNTNINFHNADTIESTVDRHNLVIATRGNGSTINYEANNITFNKSEVLKIIQCLLWGIRIHYLCTPAMI